MPEIQIGHVPFQDFLSLWLPTTVISSDDRRSAVRLRCKLPVTLRVGDVERTVTVVDVTIQGLSLETEDALLVEQSVSLARDDFGKPWEGKVGWCRAIRGGEGFRAGVLFPNDKKMMRRSWLEPALKQSGFEVERPGDRRRLLRVSGRVPCQVKSLSDDFTASGEMLDLSLGGAKVESSVELPSRLSVQFETEPLGGLPALRGQARITSCRPAPESGKWRSGLRFSQCNDQDVLLYMNSMLRSKWSER